jgi:hypothetical protein
MEPSKKPSRLGMISFILAILIVVAWCVYLVVFANMSGISQNADLDAEGFGYLVVLGGSLVMSIITILLSISGIITGVLALRNKDPKRGLAISGLVLNFLCFVPYCLILIFVAASGMSFGQ